MTLSASRREEMCGVVTTIASSAALGEAIAQAFAGAQEDDVSLLYLSTHGLYDASRPDEPARLLLSNGVAEDSITAAQLAEYLDGVPGTKVIILDACNSGAFIGKGMPVSVVRSMSLPLNRAGYKVIASSGGYEDAFYWNAGGYGAQGSSYFALALYHALTPQGGQYEADQNRDGAITLEELSDYLLRANGTSSVQCYPEQDDFVLFSYDVQAVPDTSTAAIAYFSLGNSILTYDDPTLTFSFTALRDARISYQIVYHQQGRWMWESAQRILDTSESADGMVRAGRKERALSLSVDSLASDVAGYALLQVIAESDAGTEVAESRLISVQPIVGNPQLSLAAPLSAERKLVLVREFDPLKNDISEIAASLPEDVCLIFDMEDPDWKPDKRTKAYKELAKYGFFAEFHVASPEELAGFIKRCFKDRGHSIEQAETEYLIFLCTNLMAGLLQEIEKIAAYAHDERITRADIDAVASRAVESRVFELCNELAANHTGRALLLLADLETSREPAIAVTAVIARQFRQLYAARLALESGHDRAYIMQLTGLRFPYHANRLIDSARRIPLSLLRYALLSCMEADAELKSSRAADYDTVRMLIMRYAAKAAEV